MSRETFRQIAPLVLLLSVSCGSKGAVAVTASIRDPQMAVGRSSGLAAQLTGDFRLHVELGKMAPSGTDVSFGQGNFSLVDPTTQATLTLLAFTMEPPPPHRLDPGGKLDIAFTIAEKEGMPGQLLTKEEESALCDSERAVQIAGTLTDSNGQTPVTSLGFAVGCP
jgi:hypothetical protein